MSEVTENKETLEKQKAEADANQESNNEAVEQEEMLAEDAVEEVVNLKRRLLNKKHYIYAFEQTTII